MEGTGMPTEFGRKPPPMRKYPLPSEESTLEFVRPGEPHVVTVRGPAPADGDSDDGGQDGSWVDGVWRPGSSADGAAGDPQAAADAAFAQPAKKRGDRGKKHKRKLEVVE
mmetsp:Transcript_69878/g.183264  ORF Transcript_69878/g.183264 Transcript_69878/m.183264 type:complete len:110 (-) Transcript_69878:26-355(-)